ncbi:hypothetical protein [Pseudanabaena sp. UWO310]|uniref:hypothetical protein n=1 Tax=Pseudanabaena sp. UWO310 TaxID=2480795 RepID=UPI0011595DDE|nr:hypothetical protein [Pseudanabaena sp. UWO310]TYQ29259.1 hypothetical protein PseudUWO310_13275 [Pseudanabaena sp. UWO310]
MTTLVNLESYLECCQYAHLFEVQLESLIPSANTLPSAYLIFCKKFINHSFLPVASLSIHQPQKLGIRSQSISYNAKNIGLNIDDQIDQQIAIVRETDSLKMQSFDVSQYLYINVYRYWNYAPQLIDLANSSKYLVIYDLDSFTPDQIFPLTFENRSNSRYRIPIIDTRTIKQYGDLNLSISNESIYDNICNDMAAKILVDLNLDNFHLQSVVAYIQKINFFQNLSVFLSDVLDEHISLIFEIDSIFYIYNLSLKDLEAIIYQNLPIRELQDTINKNSQFNFVLLSSYTQLPSMRDVLTRHFSTSLLIINNSQNVFKDIWREKLNSQFPLYGQHLDRISFFVKKDREVIEISLPPKVCYEGDQELTVYAAYDKNGIEEEEFTIKKDSVVLQFKINDEPFINRETLKEQCYKIGNQYFDEAISSETKIKVRFRIKPGIIPKLEILDHQGRILNSSLVDFEEPTPNLSLTSGFLPLYEILLSRHNKSNRLIDTLNQEWSSFSIQLKDDFTDFANLFDNYHQNPSLINQISQKSSNLVKLINQYGRIDENDRGKRGLELYLNIDISQDNSQGAYIIKQTYEKIGLKIASFLATAKLLGFTTNNKSSKEHNIAYKKILEIAGKGYAFTKNVELNFLYELQSINYGNIYNLPHHDKYIYSIHLHNIARMSCSSDRQLKYVSLFNSSFPFSHQKFYHNNDYIWGYARILMWYVDFNNQLIKNVYKQHFGTIVNHCCSLDITIKSNRDYTRDALIALIYLLSFRESDPEFIQIDSPLYNQAKKLCNQLSLNPIRSQRANIEEPLNSFLDRLLDGIVTQDQMLQMIEID